MTKNVATVETTNVDELISQLRQLGFRLECPDTGCAHGFTSEGDGPIHLATQDVAAFLVEGSGVLLWRGSSDSVYVSVIAGKPRVHFDGFTPAEEKALCDSLLQVGVRFSVVSTASRVTATGRKRTLVAFGRPEQETASDP